MLLAGAGGHCRTLPDLQPGLYRSRRQQVSLDGPGEGDTMQGPGCQQGRGQQGAETLSREDGREPPPVASDCLPNTRSETKGPRISRPQSRNVNNSDYEALLSRARLRSQPCQLWWGAGRGAGT